MMKKLYIGSFVLTLLIYLLFVISYPLQNSSENVVEELSFSSLMVSFPKHRYPGAAEEYVAALERAAFKAGIDPNKGLFDAIEDNDKITDVMITEVATVNRKVLSSDPWETKVDSLLLTFTSETLGAVRMGFLISDKSLLPPNLSYFIMLQSLSVNGQDLINGGYGPEVEQIVENIYYPREG